MKRVVSFALALAMALALCAPVWAAEELPKSFSDLPTGHWAHKYVMPMVQQGLFRGTSTPVNGVAAFSPDRTMTRAEFLAVVTRHLFADELAAMEAAQPWYRNNYNIAVNKGLVTVEEMPPSSLTEGIPRQEMAMVLVRAAANQGDTIPKGVSESRIADHSKIGEHYALFVRICFAMGMLKGHDAKGTFAPKDTVTRAEGAVALCRLVNADMREPEASAPTGYVGYRDGTNPDEYMATSPDGYQWVRGTQMFNDWANNQEPITIVYGNLRYNRLAIEGDTYIKKDGTAVILQRGPSGVVGEGQGLVADLGLVWGSNKYLDHIVHMDGSFKYDKSAVTPDRGLRCSSGHEVYGESYKINATTGEGHFRCEWELIMQNPAYTKYIEERGEVVGQVSPDPLHLWVWAGYAWVDNYTSTDLSRLDYDPWKDRYQNMNDTGWWDV